MVSLPLIHRAHPRYAAAAAGLALLLCAAAPAAAQDRVPPNNGGLTQYIPPRPDAGGDGPSNPASPGRPDALPASTRAALPPGGEGRLLARIATSPGYGAVDGADGGGDEGRSGAGSDDGGTGAVRAGKRFSEDGGTAASAVTSATSDSDVAILFAALVALTLGAIAFGRARRRSS